jgi:Holliday junction resolvase RusA-like endonuclease
MGISSTMKTPIFRTIIRVDSHVVKKNNRPIFGRGTRKFIGKSDKLRSAENNLILFLKKDSKLVLNGDTLTGDLHCSFIFGMDNYYTKEGKRNRKLPDLSNLIQLPEDCLQTAGIIEDDTDICCLDGSMRIPAKYNFIDIVIYRFTQFVV